MDFLKGLITNQFFLVTMGSWLFVQITKVIIHAIINKKFDIKRIFGDGGMPSGHAAMVCSFATYAAIVFGADSFQFAASMILVLIVCRDAMGVRREAGKQAVVLNEMLKKETVKKPDSITLKEFVGHTPLQVLVGGLLGAAGAVVGAVITGVLF